MVLFRVYRQLNPTKILKGTRCLYSENSDPLVKCYSTQTEKWDLISAVSVERKPIIARRLNEIEDKMINLLRKTELENSKKSDHEIQILMDKIKVEQLKKGDSKIDLDSIPERSAQDFEDASIKELNSFKFSDFKTETDKKNDIKSLDRHLDRNLVLLVKEKIGNTSIWILPQGIRQEGETLRQTAERVLTEKCGSELKVDFYGNAPIGFYKYKYPKEVREKSDLSVGAKIFFYKAQYREGSVTIDSTSLSDYQWATRGEISVLPKDYYKSVTMFLIDEEH